MKIATGIVALAAGSMALAGCTKPANPTTPPAVETAKAGKTPIGSSTDKCDNGLQYAGTYSMSVTPSFHVIHTGHKQGEPHHPGQLDTTTILKDGQYATISIQLNGTLDFQATDAFKIKDTGAPLIFCALVINGNTLTFNTYRNPNLPTSAAYALGLVVHDGSDSIKRDNRPHQSTTTASTSNCRRLIPRAHPPANRSVLSNWVAVACC